MIVTLDEARGEIIVADGRSGRERFRYVYGARKRPYLHPVATPAGHVLTTNAPADHPWHHGLWFTIKFVNGENFWEEHDAYGVLRHEGVPVVEHEPDGDGAVHLRGGLVWIRPDRETIVVREQRQISYVPIDDGAYAIDLDTTLVPEVDVVLDRTPFTTWGGYSGLTFRGRPDLHDTKLRVGDDVERDRALGEPARWLDLTGALGEGGDGDPVVGITMLDGPTSPRHPVPWYASTRAATYGATSAEDGWSNFVNAAFLWDGPLEVARGTGLRFTARVLLHDGRWPLERIEAEADAYRNGQKPPWRAPS